MFQFALGTRLGSAVFLRIVCTTLPSDLTNSQQNPVIQNPQKTNLYLANISTLRCASQLFHHSGGNDFFIEKNKPGTISVGWFFAAVPSHTGRRPR